MEDLCDCIELRDVPGKAHHVLEQIEKGFTSRSENPQRGAHPNELPAMTIREYREIFLKTLSHHLPGHGRERLGFSHRLRTSRYAGAAAEGVSPGNQRQQESMQNREKLRECN
ncbi:MAG: hypothetical protein ACP5IL_16555 [Syntrophobacteraceae bacterium]